jgi:hypothetical protein
MAFSILDAIFVYEDVEIECYGRACRSWNSRAWTHDDAQTDQTSGVARACPGVCPIHITLFNLHYNRISRMGYPLTGHLRPSICRSQSACMPAISRTTTSRTPSSSSSAAHWKRKCINFKHIWSKKLIFQWREAARAPCGVVAHFHK